MTNEKKSIDEKLYTVKTKSDNVSHLIPDDSKCILCQQKSCTFVCPANVYHWDEKQEKLLVAYENCLECGACRIVCDKNCLDWHYPKSGCGITFKHS